MTWKLLVWVGGWWVLNNYTDNKAISAQLSLGWGLGWAWQYLTLLDNIGWYLATSKNIAVYLALLPVIWYHIIKVKLFQDFFLPLFFAHECNLEKRLLLKMQQNRIWLASCVLKQFRYHLEDKKKQILWGFLHFQYHFGWRWWINILGRRFTILY